MQGTARARRGIAVPGPRSANFPAAERARNTVRVSRNIPLYPTPSISTTRPPAIQRNPRDFSKRMPSPFPRSRELPFAVFLVSHCTISSLPAAPAELEISLSSSEAKKKKKKKKSQGKRCNIQREGSEASGNGRAPGPCEPRSTCTRLVGIQRYPVRHGAGMNTSLVSADDFTSLACS